MKLNIYLSDLYHDYFGAKQFVPINIGYIGAYAREKFGDNVDIQLFKSADRLLDAIDVTPPHMLALSNYCWNENLNRFVAANVKARFPDIPIVMGGPNISLGDHGIEEFLRRNDFIDTYTMFSSERVFSDLVESVLVSDAGHASNSERIKNAETAGAYSLIDGQLKGLPNDDAGKELDFIPSPYLGGMLDPFLDQNMIPIFETNRGCPFSCTFCVWGISALNKLKQFSLDRIYQELDYVTHYGMNFPHIYFADANFGILKRDVEIAEKIRQLYEETKSFSAVEMYWSKSAQPHMLDVGKALGHLSHTYVAFQSLDPVVLEGMKRTNIGLDKLSFLIEGLKEYSHSAQTDILLGAPGETVESHLKSLDGVISYGIDHIRGGEVQLLPGSELESSDMRSEHGIKTKYRFFEGCAGIYRGELVYKLQEVIRATNSMTEDEMKYLRLLRSLFFGAVTIGEFIPAVYVLRHLGKSFTGVLTQVLALAPETTEFSAVLDWVREQIEIEFFENREDAAKYLNNSDARTEFIENGFFKLNFGVSANLMKNREAFEDYYRCMERALNIELEDAVSPEAVNEILSICRQRNFLASALNGETSNNIRLDILAETKSLLRESGYLKAGGNAIDTNVLLSLDQLTAERIEQSVSSKGDGGSLFDLSQIMQMYWGRTYLEPVHPDQ
jgi:radical SAM superfamily enzyme YgiQ (UPF0313 family)